MLGILSWLVYGCSILHQSGIESVYEKKSYERSKNNNSKYYYDGKGKKHFTETGEKCYLCVESNGHKTLRSVKNDSILWDYTNEEHKKSTNKSKMKAIVNNDLVYRDYSCKHKILSKNVFFSIDGTEVFEEETLPRSCDKYYYPLTFVKKENGINFYKRDPSKEFLYCSVNFNNPHIKKWERIGWREFQKRLCIPVKNRGYYCDEFRRKINENNRKYEIVFSYEDDSPWCLERNYNIVSKIWKVYENKDGSFTKETKWYIQGNILNINNKKSI